MKTEVIFIHDVVPRMFGQEVERRVEQGFRIVPETMFGKFERVGSGINSNDGFFCCEMIRVTRDCPDGDLIKQLCGNGAPFGKKRLDPTEHNSSGELWRER